MDKLAIAILKALHDGVVTKGEAVEYCRMYGIRKSKVICCYEG